MSAFADQTLLVTTDELDWCRQCPRLLRYLRDGKFVPPKPTDWQRLRAGLLEELVHDIHGIPQKAHLFSWNQAIQQGGDGLSRQLNILWERDYLLPWLRRVSASRSLRQIQNDSRLVERLADAWAKFIRRAAGPHPSEDLVLRNLCPDPEDVLHGDYLAKNGARLTVRGSWPGLLCDWENGEALLIDLVPTLTDDEGLFQRLSLYSWLVERSLGLATRARVLSHEGEDSRYSAAALATAAAQLPILFNTAVGTLTQTLVLPRLHEQSHCGLCPHQSHCNIHDDDALAVTQDAEQLALLAQWNQALQRLKLPTQVLRWQRGPKLWQLNLRPRRDQNVTVEQLLAAGPTLAGLLNQPLLLLPDGTGGVNAEQPRRAPQPWSDTNSAPRTPPAFPLGYTVIGQPHWGSTPGLWLTGSQLVHRLAWVSLWHQWFSRWLKADSPLSLLVLDPHLRLAALPHGRETRLHDPSLASLALRSLNVRLNNQTRTMQAWSVVIAVDLDDWLNRSRSGPALRDVLNLLRKTPALFLVSAEQPLMDELWQDLPRLVCRLDNRADSDRCLGVSGAIDLTQGDGLLAANNGPLIRVHHPDWGQLPP